MKDPLGRPPIVLMVPAILATLLLVVPLVAMVGATNWAALPGQLRSEPLREALWLSLTTSTAASLICLVLGLPLPGHRSAGPPTGGRGHRPPHGVRPHRRDR
jgi:molybdate transport system permease protein